MVPIYFQALATLTASFALERKRSQSIAVAQHAAG